MVQLPPDYAIRPATRADCPLLPVIERAADGLFKGSGLLDGLGRPEDARLTEVDALEKAADDALLWVATYQGKTLTGFVICEVIEGHFYLEQVSVHPSHGRKGLGRALTLTACYEARTRGLLPVTLSTFRTVPWNGPFYARLGFKEIPRDAYAPWLQKIAQKEAQRLDMSKRCFMRWDG